MKRYLSPSSTLWECVGQKNDCKALLNSITNCGQQSWHKFTKGREVKCLEVSQLPKKSNLPHQKKETQGLSHDFKPALVLRSSTHSLPREPPTFLSMRLPFLLRLRSIAKMWPRSFGIVKRGSLLSIRSLSSNSRVPIFSVTLWSSGTSISYTPADRRDSDSIGQEKNML